MKINILTLFPEMFLWNINYGIIKRAQEKNLLKINLVNIRDFANNKHKQVDDYPYGGGNGMILMAEPILSAFDSLKLNGNYKTIISTPRGMLFNYKLAESLAKEETLVFICGHYEGIDERVYKILKPLEISIGDYILSCGEIPTLVMIDAIVRHIPNALKEEARKKDSFYSGLLEYPQYTRPREVKGMKVPDVLLSGDHEKIRKYQMKEALKITLMNRPELIDYEKLTYEEKELIEEIKNEL
jgi:tRNA (guanine37-N1)-methyltransferase